jgi:DNA sulfur modification protein DndC
MTNRDGLIAENQNKVALVVNLSAVKYADAWLSAHTYPEIPTYCVMAETHSGGGWTIYSARFGVELQVVRNPNKTYREMVRNRGMFPSAQFRQCTSDLKCGPIQKFTRTLRHPVIINCTGMRAQESARLAKQRP